MTVSSVLRKAETIEVYVKSYKLELRSSGEIDSGTPW